MIVCWEISIKKAIRVARIRKRPVLPAPASSMGGVRGLSPSWYLGALFPVYLDARAPQKVTYLSGFFRKKFLTRAQRSRRPIKQKRPVFRGCRPFLRGASGEKQAVPRHILVFVDYRRLGGRKISAFPKNYRPASPSPGQFSRTGLGRTESNRGPSSSGGTAPQAGAPARRANSSGPEFSLGRLTELSKSGRLWPSLQDREIAAVSM